MPLPTIQPQFARVRLGVFLAVVLLAASSQASPAEATPPSQHFVSAAPPPGPAAIVNPDGGTVQTRFRPPPGFVRAPLDPASFGQWLRDLKLKPPGAHVRYFDGLMKDDAAYIAVVDMDLGKRDLQQCADAIIRLRAEYFFAHKDFDHITFNLTNGFPVAWTRWRDGERVAVSGNRTTWHKSSAPSRTYAEFRRYLDFVFTYAGTLSLARSLHAKPLQDVAIGDVFVVGGAPGHAVLVADVAVNAAGKKVFLLAQSYMPAQDTQILRNPDDAAMSPWYPADFRGPLRTPEWTFARDQLKSW